MESTFQNGGMIGQPMNFYSADRYFVNDVTEVIIGGTVNENGTLNLSTPGGQLFTRVVFASFGTPNGTSPDFTLGGCHSPNSVSVVESLAIGQSSVSIPATNGTFGGDPCPGTPKRLYVALAYNVDNSGFRNRKNSGMWSIDNSLYKTPVLPDNVIAYAPFVGTNGSTLATVYTPGVVHDQGFVATGTSQISNQQTVMTNANTSAFASANAVGVGWELSSTIANILRVGAASPISFEFWWYNSGFITGDFARLFSFGGNGDTNGGVEIESASTSTTSYNLFEYLNGSTRRTTRSITFTVNQWHHIYIAINPSGTCYTGINGAVSTHTQYITNFNPSRGLSLGFIKETPITDSVRGYYQELVVRNNIPYTTNFTPSTNRLIQV